MKFIKAEEIQKHWFSDEKDYEEVLAGKEILPGNF